jgi:hypothetical protein
MKYKVGDRVLIKSTGDSAIKPYFNTVHMIVSVRYGREYPYVLDGLEPMVGTCFCDEDFVGKVYDDKNKLIKE